VTSSHQKLQEKLQHKLVTLIGVVLEEAEANPAFARRLESVFEGGRLGLEERLQMAAPTDAARIEPKSSVITQASFDPLEVHLEAALVNGKEQEARAFLHRLSRSQLEDVVKAQRLPNSRALQKTISEAQSPSAAVDSIVESAAQKARGRVAAAQS
jgi:hypothetical protein